MTRGFRTLGFWWSLLVMFLAALLGVLVAAAGAGNWMGE